MLIIPTNIIPSNPLPKRNDSNNNKSSQPVMMAQQLDDATSAETAPAPATLKKIFKFEKYHIDTTVTEETEIVDKWIHDTYQAQSNRSRILVGLDAEWKPTFKKGQHSKVAILQLCTQAQKCLIIQLIHMNEIPISLKSFLTDPKCLFMGNDIGHDAKKLRKEYGLEVRDILDLQKAAKKYLPFKLERFSLVELAQNVAGFSLKKSKKTCMSNWERRHLSENQIRYACLDAFASLLVGEQISLYMPKPPSTTMPMCMNAIHIK